MTQLQKHMLSDMKWYGWLTGRVAAVGRCYGLAFELQNTVYAEIFAEQEANGIFAISIKYSVVVLIYGNAKQKVK